MYHAVIDDVELRMLPEALSVDSNPRKELCAHELVLLHHALVLAVCFKDSGDLLRCKLSLVGLCEHLVVGGDIGHDRSLVGLDAVDHVCC